MSMFQKASRKQKKLRMSLSGPSGSGKTYTALMLAAALAAGEGKPGKAAAHPRPELGAGRSAGVAIIDTERGSASLYSDRFQFEVCELENFNPDNYIKAIHEAAETGYEVLVIDSLSHAWVGQGGVLDQVNKRGGNSFTEGWGKVGTPLQNRLMDAILNAPMHIIATMRVKSDYVIEINEQGKSVPRRVGLKEVQREGVEYEFDIVGTLDLSNALTIEKSRMTELSGALLDKPDAKLAARILNWLNEGGPTAAVPPRTDEAVPPRADGESDQAARPVFSTPVPTDQVRWTAFCKEHGFAKADIEAALGTPSVVSWMRERSRTLDDAMNAMVDWATLSETRQGTLPGVGGATSRGEAKAGASAGR
jgi:hypothetical protein